MSYKTFWRKETKRKMGSLDSEVSTSALQVVERGTSSMATEFFLGNAGSVGTGAP